MARWFNNGTKMADGTLISFAARTEVEVKECLAKGWIEVVSENVEAFTEEDLTRSPSGEVPGITKSGNQRKKPGRKPNKKVVAKKTVAEDTTTAPPEPPEGGEDVPNA